MMILGIDSLMFFIVQFSSSSFLRACCTIIITDVFVERLTHSCADGLSFESKKMFYFALCHGDGHRKLVTCFGVIQHV